MSIEGKKGRERREKHETLGLTTPSSFDSVLGLGPTKGSKIWSQRFLYLLHGSEVEIEESSAAARQ